MRDQRASPWRVALLAGTLAGLLAALLRIPIELFHRSPETVLTNALVDGVGLAIVFTGFYLQGRMGQRKRETGRRRAGDAPLAL